MNLLRRFLASCIREKIPENTARQLTEAFKDEEGRYPRTFEEALLAVCK